MSLNPVPVRWHVEGAPEALLIHLTGTHESGIAERLRALSGGRGFAYAALEVSDWNRDLSPWPAPPVFGDEAFAGRADETLDRLLGDALPRLEKRLGDAGRAPGLPRCVGGYSLAGLFALWAFYRCDAFAAAAAASPSVWFPGWDEYAEAHRPGGRAACLSLGKREPRTRNRRMATIGDAIQRQRDRFETQGVRAILEWNEGNHFAEPGLRTAKGFAWAAEMLSKSEAPAGG